MKNYLFKILILFFLFIHTYTISQASQEIKEIILCSTKNFELQICDEKFTKSYLTTENLSSIQNYKINNIEFKFIKVNGIYTIFMDESKYLDYRNKKEISAFLEEIKKADSLTFAKDGSSYNFENLTRSIFELIIYLVIINFFIIFLSIKISKKLRILYSSILLVLTIYVYFVWDVLNKFLSISLNNIFTLDENRFYFILLTGIILTAQIIIINKNFNIKSLTLDFKTQTKKNLKIHKFIFPLSFVFLFIGFVVFHLYQNIEILALSISAIVTVLTVLAFESQKNNQKDITFSNTEKTYLSLLVIVLASIFIYFSDNYNLKNILQKKSDLFLTDKNIILPKVIKNSGETFLDNKLAEEINKDIFVDQYLIYSPGFNKILNTNYQKISKEDSGYLVSEKLSDIIRVTINDYLLKEKIIEEGFSQFTVFKKVSFGEEQNSYNFESNINCENILSNEISIKYFKVSNTKAKENNLKLGDIGNCSGDNHVFNFSIPSKLISEENVFQFDPLIFKSVKNTDSDLKTMSIPIEKSLFYFIDFIDESKNEIIKNYIITDTEINFEQDNTNFIDNLNDLIIKNKLKNNFYLWSNNILIIVN